MLAQLDVIQVINTLGVPVGIMVVMGYGIYKLFNWASPRIDKMIDKTQETMAKVADSSAQSAQALTLLVPVSQSSAKAIENFSDKQEDSARKLDEILAGVKDVKEKLKDK